MGKIMNEQNYIKTFLYLFLIFPSLFFSSNAGFTHDPQKNIAANKIFSKFSTPTKGDTSAVGSYARGCLKGGALLPETGDTWQVMRTSRNRNWAHHITVDFAKRLSEKAMRHGWLGLYIGDLSQPRGGPMPYGHKSHQIGLDIDFWLTPPERLNHSLDEREKLEPISVRSKDQRNVNANWTNIHMKILKEAAMDPVVDRIFITAPAKIWMCENTTGQRDWLQKVRPLGGHHRHFHVRLKCPETDANCISQKPTIPQISQSADGCDHTLEWWVTKALEPRKPGSKTKSKTKKKTKTTLTYVPEDLPDSCLQVIHAD